jgi:hypothetical protein
MTITNFPQTEDPNRVYPPLTEYLVIYSDGERRPTSLAAGITLEQAREYFIGKRFEITETTFHTTIDVQEISHSASGS